jgi:hypothetical protein
MSRYENGRFCAHAVPHTRGTTHQRHPPQLPIHKINSIAFRVVDAQVDQDDHKSTIWSSMTSARTSSRFTDSSVSS